WTYGGHRRPLVVSLGEGLGRSVLGWATDAPDPRRRCGGSRDWTGHTRSGHRRSRTSSTAGFVGSARGPPAPVRREQYEPWGAPQPPDAAFATGRCVCRARGGRDTAELGVSELRGLGRRFRRRAGDRSLSRLGSGGAWSGRPMEAGRTVLGTAGEFALHRASDRLADGGRGLSAPPRVPCSHGWSLARAESL